MLWSALDSAHDLHNTVVIHLVQAGNPTCQLRPSSFFFFLSCGKSGGARSLRLHHYVLLLCSLLSSPSMFFCTSASWTTFSQRTPTRTYTRTRTLSTLTPLHSKNFIPMHKFQIFVQTAVTLLLHLISCLHATFFNAHVAILMITECASTT